MAVSRPNDKFLSCVHADSGCLAATRDLLPSAFDETDYSAHGGLSRGGSDLLCM